MGKRPRANWRASVMASSSKSAMRRARTVSERLLVESSAFQGVGIEGQADQLLAETVMEVLADAGLFAVADLEDLALEALALGDVFHDAINPVHLSVRVSMGGSGDGGENGGAGFSFQTEFIVENGSVAHDAGQKSFAVGRVLVKVRDWGFLELFQGIIAMNAGQGGIDVDEASVRARGFAIYTHVKIIDQRAVAFLTLPQGFLHLVAQGGFMGDTDDGVRLPAVVEQRRLNRIEPMDLALGVGHGVFHANRFPG